MGSDGSTGDVGSVVMWRVMCYSRIWSRAGWARSASRGLRTLVAVVHVRSPGRTGCAKAVGVRGPGAGSSWGPAGAVRRAYFLGNPGPLLSRTDLFILFFSF